MSEHSSPDDLQGRLRQVRENLDSHSEEVVRQIRSQFDWRNIVAKHPLAALGAAAAAGFLLAPRRFHCQCAGEKSIKETIEKAVGRAQPPSPEPLASGLVAGVASMVMATLVREGISFASQFARNVFETHAEERRHQADSRKLSSAGPQATTNGKH